MIYTVVKLLKDNETPVLWKVSDTGGSNWKMERDANMIFPFICSKQSSPTLF